MRELVLDDQGGGNFMGAWFLEDISICDHLITLFESNPDRQVPGSVGGDNIDKDLKNNTEIYFMIDEPEIYGYHLQLQKVCEEYIKKYPYCDRGRWSIIETMKIQKYMPPDQGYHAWHCEREHHGLMLSRHLVFLTYLNDVTDAGETEFYHQKIKVKPQKGLTIIWPSDWTHTHRGLVSPTQTKYIMTGWYNLIGNDVKVTL